MRFSPNLFDTAMKVSYDAFDIANTFPIKLQNHTKHAVRGRMLRAHVEDELAGIEIGSFRLDQRIFDHLLPALDAEIVFDPLVVHPGDRCVFAQGVTAPIFRHQNAL